MTTSPLLHTAVPPRLILLTLIRRSRGHAIAWPVGKAGDDRRDERDDLRAVRATGERKVTG